MSGINPSRRNFSGRGGQGFKNNNNDGRKNASTNKNLQDFTFYVSNKKQAIDYENTALFVINHTKNNFYRGTILPKLCNIWNTKIRINGIQF